MTPRVLMIPAQSNPYQAMLADALRAQGTTVRLGGGPSRIPIAPVLLAWVRAGRPRVVHLHWMHRYLSPILGRRRWAARRTTLELRILRRLGVRLVWTLHNVGEHDGSQSDLEPRFNRRLISLADAVICHCGMARQLAIDAYELPGALHPRLQVIAHGNYAGWYPDTMDRAAARERLGLGSTDRVFLFIGQVRRYKGVEELLEAFRGLDAPSARLIVAGMPKTSRTQAAIEQQAAGDPRVVLALENIPDVRMQVYLRAADAVVLPYRDVLSSGSAILAMTFGQPVIAPAIGCLPESLGSEGTILYDAAAPDGLIGALRGAMSADLVELGERASAHAATLSWGPIATRTAELYAGDAKG
jgi:beta-1,4-mannosyltransferase